MRFLRFILARYRAWRLGVPYRASLESPLMLTFGPSIYRDVTPTGVRVYSICGGCGARLQCSATLCEECARGPHPSTFQ